MMPPLRVLLSQQIEPEPVLRTGWLDPLFLFFIVACAAQLFVFVWLFATDVNPKVGDGASHAPDTPPDPMPEPPAPSPPPEASTAVHDQERSPARTSELQSRLLRPDRKKPLRGRHGREELGPVPFTSPGRSSRPRREHARGEAHE